MHAGYVSKESVDALVLAKNEEIKLLKEEIDFLRQEIHLLLTLKPLSRT